MRLFYVLVIVFGVFYSYRISTRGVDFEINYKAGCLVKEGKIEYNLKDEFPHKFPSFVSEYFSCFCSQNKVAARIMFFWITLLSIAISLHIGMLLLGGKSILYYMVLPILLLLRSFLWEFDLGNINHLILLFLMLSLLLYQKNKIYLSSLMLCVSVLIKLFPGLMLVYFVIKKKYKFAAYSVLNIFILLFIFPLLMYGFNGTIERLILWSQALFGNPAWTYIDKDNQSLLGMLSRLFNPDTARYLYYGLFLAITGLWALYIKKEADFNKGVAITIGLMVILSPLCWIQTFLVALFFVQYVCSRFCISKSKKILYIIIASWILSQATNQELVGRVLEDGLLFYSDMFWGWILLFLIIIDKKGYKPGSVLDNHSSRLLVTQ